VLVGIRFAVGRHPDDENDGSDEWNKSDQQPPAAAADVVQPPNRYSDARKEYREPIDRLQGTDTARRLDQARGGVHYGQDDTDDEVDEHEHPILFSPGPAVEHRILLQDIQVPVHAHPLSNRNVGRISQVRRETNRPSVVRTKLTHKLANAIPWSKTRGNW